MDSQAPTSSATDSSHILMLKCPITGCKWDYPSVFGPEQSFQLINIHISQEHVATSVPVVPPAKAPKLSPPKIDVGVDPETWQAFTIRWRQYCRGSQISREVQSLQLFECASNHLGNLLLRP